MELVRSVPMRQVVIGSALAMAHALLLSPALAQSTALKPATQDEISAYTGMAAINICALNKQEVPLEKALRASVQMFVTVLDGRHGGVIEGVNDGKKLSDQQLINGGTIEMAIRVNSICGKEFTGNNKVQLDKIMADINKAASSSPSKNQPQKN
jgi:hypothetical protein